MSFSYKISRLTILSTVTGYAEGDCAKVFSNNGSGAVVETDPYTDQCYDMYQTFPNNELSITVGVAVYGWWLFQVHAYDKAGNIHAGTPDEEGIWPLLEPQKESRPVIHDLDTLTNQLTISRK